ncbi:hypothetical protein NYE24_30680 [Paenibacillus sp. FSL H7-0350]|uniref:hypothetical protein n=1 Tax=Paenibacillus sp. FSL H7-0350 TaxID=2975345 RepID=UPI0031594F30
MLKAETVEQFYILQWLEANFEIEHLEIKLVDRYNVKIKDLDNKIARVTYVSRDNITLTDDITY